ncbi:MAG: hypothetical protein ACXVJD_05960 [Mucilaginibacter sp.]
MKTLAEFRASLELNQPQRDFSPQLKSLWYDAKGDWNQAHRQVDQFNDRQSAWVHAYLHRKEGDIGNSNYWYRKAGQVPSNLSFEDEWEHLVAYFLHN